MKTTRNTIIALVLVAFIGLCATPAHAQEEAGSAAALAVLPPTEAPDTRAATIRAFLRTHDSPLAQEAETFVREADRHNLSWKLLVAIAGTESTFGKHIPEGSYNAWGWGIPTGAQSGVGFTSWEHGIQTISSGLRTNYIDKGAVTLDQIGAIYAASPAWSAHVRFFIEKIDSFIPADPAVLQVNI